VEQEAGLKQISRCCEAFVRYKKVCSGCGRELEQEDILKGFEVDKQEVKVIESEKLKIEQGNLRILGVVKEDSEENGFFRDGLVWYLGIETFKNKEKNQRNLLKFAYLREVLRDYKVLGIISVRGKEHIVLLKAFEKGILATGIYFIDRIRDIKEIENYNLLDGVPISEEILRKMREDFEKKESVNIREIENKRDKILKELLIADATIEKPTIEKPTSAEL
jgi:DNA end-binding protein Ku